MRRRPAADAATPVERSPPKSSSRHHNCTQIRPHLARSQRCPLKAPPLQQQLHFLCCRRRAELMATPGISEAQLAAAPPVNSQLLQTTLGVTSEGFQDALTDALFCGGMLPPPEGGVEEVGTHGHL